MYDVDDISRVYVKDVIAEILFEWFRYSIMSQGGDGSAVIVCENPKQVSEWFEEWYDKDSKFKLRDGKELDIYDYEGSIIYNYHDMNENFMFSNGEINLPFNDVNFVVKEKCPFADRVITRWIRPIK